MMSVFIKTTQIHKIDKKYEIIDIKKQILKKIIFYTRP